MPPTGKHRKGSSEWSSGESRLNFALLSPARARLFLLARGLDRLERKARGQDGVRTFAQFLSASLRLFAGFVAAHARSPSFADWSSRERIGAHATNRFCVKPLLRVHGT